MSPRASRSTGSTPSSKTSGTHRHVPYPSPPNSDKLKRILLEGMTVATQFEILDLRHFSARQLRPLLENESRLWQERLRWNYQSSTELLLQYLDSRILPGFRRARPRTHLRLHLLRLRGAQGCGRRRVCPGDRRRTQMIHITQLLLHHLLQLLQHSPGIQRVESQLLLYDAGSIDEPFLAAGFTMFPRLFMEYDLSQSRQRRRTIQETCRGLPPYIGLASWSSDHYQAAAELIHASYIGHVDARINDQYCSLHGSLALSAQHRSLPRLRRLRSGRTPGCCAISGTAP